MIHNNSTLVITQILPSAAPTVEQVSSSSSQSQRTSPMAAATAAAAAALATPTSTPMTTVAATTTTTVNRIEKPERNLWREQEMLAVLQIICEKKLLPLLNDKTVRSEAVFRKVEKEMFERGFCKKNFQQIWTKWKFLKSTYMTSRRVHQIPKIIPLEVYESLDELLCVEFQNDGSMSSYDGGDYEDVGSVTGGAGASNTNPTSSGSMLMMSGGSGSYEMMNASVSTTGSSDGYLPVISSLQGCSTPSVASSNTLFNGSGGGSGGGSRNYAPDLNGFAGIGMRRSKFKNGFRSSFKNEEDTNGFGMQHPIFGYRLGVVKDEPIDNEYENNNNTTAETEESFAHVHTTLPDELTNGTTQNFPEIKPELASPPASPSPSPSPSATSHDGDHLSVPVNQSRHSSTGHSMEAQENPLRDPHMPPLHRYTPPTYQASSILSADQQHPPPLKHMPFMKIQLPPKPQITQTNNHHQPNPHNQVNSLPPNQTDINSKKIPILTLRKRKKRLNIPDLSEGTQSPAPSSKNSKISDEDDSRESPPETSRIPFVTYGKAMREMSASLREIQREMIDDFFKQQMDLAKSEHEFQKQQDAMLLRCFEDQTKLLLDGARRLFSANSQAMSMASDGVFVNDK